VPAGRVASVGPMNRFEGKAVLLTGAASGMGRATALRLTAEGAAVFGVDRSYFGRVIPLLGLGEPQDIAAAIAFAASF